MFCEKHGINVSEGSSCQGVHCGDPGCDCPACVTWAEKFGSKKKTVTASASLGWKPASA